MEAIDPLDATDTNLAGSRAPQETVKPAHLSGLHDDPYGIRTRVAGVKGRCPNR